MANFVFLSDKRINLDAVAYVQDISPNVKVPKLGVCFIGSAGNEDYDLRVSGEDVQIFEDAMRDHNYEIIRVEEDK